MSNEIKIKGNNNSVFQETVNSKISFSKGNAKTHKKQKYALTGLLIAILGLIATIVIGWDSIIKFFYK
jgi:hypothetical protein